MNCNKKRLRVWSMPNTEKVREGEREREGETLPISTKDVRCQKGECLLINTPEKTKHAVVFVSIFFHCPNTVDVVFFFFFWKIQKSVDNTEHSRPVTVLDFVCFGRKFIFPLKNLEYSFYFLVQWNVVFFFFFSVGKSFSIYFFMKRNGNVLTRRMRGGFCILSIIFSFPFFKYYISSVCVLGLVNESC